MTPIPGKKKSLARPPLLKKIIGGDVRRLQIRGLVIIALTVRAGRAESFASTVRIGREVFLHSQYTSVSLIHTLTRWHWLKKRALFSLEKI